jgi:hypothetical protein
MVAHPRVNLENDTLRYLFNNNQFGLITTANSGETFNIVSTSDMNGDGSTISDRPVGIKRNSGTTPPQFNVDLRYSRFVNFTERYKLEIFGELQNLFNVNSIIQFNNVTVTTDPTTGDLVGPLPDFRARNQSTSQDSRQFQPGFKFIF